MFPQVQTSPTNYKRSGTSFRVGAAKGPMWNRQHERKTQRTAKGQGWEVLSRSCTQAFCLLICWALVASQLVALCDLTGGASCSGYLKTRCLPSHGMGRGPRQQGSGFVGLFVQGSSCRRKWLGAALLRVFGDKPGFLIWECSGSTGRRKT